MEMNILYNNTDDKFKNLLGKKIEFIDKRGKKISGILDFAGINEKLHNKFQVTVGRTPYWPVNPKTIKEIKS
jgi:hypothetical protein